MKLKTLCVFTLSMLASGTQLGAAHADEKPFLDLSAQATVASDGMTKGISETDGNGQLLVAFTAAHGPFYATYRWKNVKSAEGGDNQQQYTAGIKQKLGEFSLQGAVWYKITDGTVPHTDARFVEWQGDISRTFFKTTTVKFTEIYSADGYAKNKETWWHELSLSQKLSPKWSVSGGVAQRDTTPKKNYNAYNVGLTYAVLKKTGIDVRYYDTDQHAFGKKYDERLVVAVTQKY